MVVDDEAIKRKRTPSPSLPKTKSKKCHPTRAEIKSVPISVIAGSLSSRKSDHPNKKEGGK